MNSLFNKPNFKKMANSSFTKLKTFKKCPEHHYQGDVCGYNPPFIKEANQGSFIHDLIEKKGVVTKKMEIEYPADIIEYGKKVWNVLADEFMAELEGATVEKLESVPLAGNTFYYKLDTFKELPDKTIRIIDWKTGKNNAQYEGENMLLQLKSYAFALWKKFGFEKFEAQYYFTQVRLEVEDGSHLFPLEPLKIGIEELKEIEKMLTELETKRYEYIKARANNEIEPIYMDKPNGLCPYCGYYAYCKKVNEA